MKPGATEAEAKASFNVFCGQSIPIIIEGDRTRVSGNFIGVLPDGKNAAGYQRTIETYGGTCDNIIIAGNYIGVAIDGTTRFTNSTTPVDASRGTGRYRLGSDFDGVSDDLEGNVVCNNWPPNLITPEHLASLLSDNLRGFWNLSTSGSITYRGNTLVNNNPFPMSPTRGDGGEPGAWLTNYYVGVGGRVLADATQGLKPVLSASSSASFLIGTAPVPMAPYTTTVLDLYLADAEGIQTGKDVGTAGGVPDFPNGFVQGRVYLKSFVVDGPADHNGLCRQRAVHLDGWRWPVLRGQGRLAVRFDRLLDSGGGPVGWELGHAARERRPRLLPSPEHRVTLATPSCAPVSGRARIAVPQPRRGLGHSVQDAA